MDSKPSKRKLRCLLCRTSNEILQLTPLFTSRTNTTKEEEKHRCWAKSCLESLCRLISIPERHPCKQFFTAGNYCSDCLQLIRDVDFTLKSLDRFQQQIIGFRDDFVAKLKDNYKAIPNPDSIDFDQTYCDSIEKTKISKKITFGYDEVIKITFKQVEEESFRWTGTDFMTGTTFKNSYDLNPCSRNAWKESRMKLESNVFDACIVPQKRRKLRYEHDKNFEDENEDENLYFGESVKEIDPTVCDEFHEDNWVASDVDESLFDVPEKEVPDKSENNDKISPTPTIKKSVQVKVSTVAQKFPCPEENCDSYLDTEYALKIHILKVHKGDPKPYHCDRCELRFKYDASLIAHKRTHKEILTQCSLCDAKFPSTSTRLEYHMKTRHNISKPECQYCGIKFDKEEEHLKHENLHLSSGTPFKCLSCEIVFTNSLDLKRHMLSHSDSTHVCDICNMQFKSYINMKRHKKYHDSSIVDNKCTECGKICRSKSHLKRHMISHSPEKKIICEICGASFKFQTSFTLHTRKHLGELPFNCKICGKGFTTSTALKRHEEIHSGILAYECSGCGKKFVSNNGLQQHEDRCPKSEKSKSAASMMRVSARWRKKNFGETGRNASQTKSKKSVRPTTTSKAARGIRSRSKRRKQKSPTPPSSDLEEDEYLNSNQ